VAQFDYRMTAPDPSKLKAELEECLNNWPAHPIAF
jgi:hypothetical protein